MKTFLSKCFNYFGIVLMLFCLYIIGDKLLIYKDDIVKSINYDYIVIVSILLISFCHLVALNLLGLAWHRHLKRLGTEINLLNTIYIYGLSQIGKYLPGNIFHFAGRQLLAKQFNLNQQTVLKATFLEITGHLIAAIALVGTLLLLSKDMLDNLTALSSNFITTEVFAFLLAMIASVFIIGILLSKRMPIINLKNIFLRKNTFLYFGFHLIAGLSFYLLLPIFSEPVYNLLPIVMASYLVAWVVGYVVPGAPGGLGVREFVLMFLLSPYFSEHLILLLSISNRVITTLGDVLYFIQALTIKNLSKRID